MRLYKNLIIPVIIAILLAAGVWVFFLNQKPKPVEPETKLIKVFTSKEALVKSIDINFEGKRIYIIKDSNDFFKLKLPVVVATSDLLSSITYEALNIFAKQIVTESAIDLKDFGFKKQLSLKISLKNGEVKVFEFGDIAKDLSGLYFREANSRKIYLMDTSKANTIFSDPASLENLNVFSSDEDSMVKIKVLKDGKLSFDIDVRNKADWKLIAPFSAPISADLIDSTYKLLASVRVEKYLKGDLKPLSEYGLEKPKYNLILQNKTEKIEILLGNFDPNKLFYGKLKNSNNIFLIDPTMINYVDWKPTGIIQKLVNLQDISDLKKMNVSFDGHVDNIDITYIKKTEKNTEKYVLNGQDVTLIQNDSAILLFKQYYESIISVVWYEAALTEKPVLGKVDFKVTYYLKDNTNYSIEFSEKNKDFYYVFKNGKFSGLSVEKSVMEPIRNTRVELIKEAERLR
ncbi:MAG: DUF4340 domain-containing protein [Bacillota bacterium]